MIAYFNVVLKRLQQSYTYGMDVYGNRFDLSVHLHSEDLNASNQAPWGYTLTVEGCLPDHSRRLHLRELRHHWGVGCRRYV